MSREGVGLKIMGCAAGMMVCAVICEQIAPKFGNPYVVLLIGLAIGAVVGYLGVSLFRRWVLKKRGSNS